MTEQATRVSDQRRSAAIGVWIVSLLAAMVIANADRGYYTDAGYNTQIRPSYWGHAVLMAFYAGSAFMLARAPKWKSALVIAAALSFGLWSGFVVDAALGLQGTSAGDAFDAFIGRAGGSSLFAGIVAGGLATAVWFGVLTKRVRVGLLIAGISMLCGVLAAFGWGEAAGGTGSKVMLFVSSWGWHLGVLNVLLAWALGPRWFQGGDV